MANREALYQAATLQGLQGDFLTGDCPPGRAWTGAFGQKKKKAAALSGSQLLNGWCEN